MSLDFGSNLYSDTELSLTFTIGRGLTAIWEARTRRENIHIYHIRAELESSNDSGELIFYGLLCNFINVLDNGIKSNENIKMCIVNVNTIITICSEQELNKNNLNVEMSE